MDWAVHGGDDRTNGLGGRQAGGKEDVGASFLVRLQAANRVRRVNQSSVCCPTRFVADGGWVEMSRRG